ncbi:O-methyltransferase [Clostridium isatidis]|uniref:tRNA 5-hydroxyuridine methyltransferase n=1 Tax=Clostridium isatidis TaxID=182773 RepID=A0A343JBU5_9CLOT|nr:O-methyltransferase [Clostridium isatidis]ASW43003.1 methyltransferase [Clostridium isatidis]NLZ35648.1 O-methyltransferase [Clostridiales bacterium]
MSGITYDYMQEYLRSLIPESSGKYLELEKFAEENMVPIVQKETAKFLEFIVSMKKPLRILELGTAIGYSAILMYEASKTNPKITTIERDKNMIELAEKNFEKYGLTEQVEIKEGECLEVLESLNEAYDLIFMDAGKGHYNHFLPHCLRLLAEDGIIVADNVLFRGMVATDELVKKRKITIVKRMREYLDIVSKDKNLITSVIPMGDGIAVTKRR